MLIDDIRRRFTAIERCPDVLMDNAGGSQVPDSVADAMRDYMLSTYVQLGADYETSRRSTGTVDRAHAFIEAFTNAGDRGRVVLGPSTSQLCIMLADAYARRGHDGRDTVVIAETAHEANAGPWARLGERGWRVRIWPVDPETGELRLEDLEPLLDDRTAIVAYPHVSNVLGRIEDARRINDLAHGAGARVVVDGVAYAPHRAIDVQALDADWYVYSTYKVFGPHMAALFGTHQALDEIDGPNHFFIPRSAVPYRFEPGGVSHEGCAGLLGLWPYLAFLAGAGPDEAPTHEAVRRAFDRIAERETMLQGRLMARLESLPGMRLVGPEARDEGRVSTVSVAHESRRSREIVLGANERRFGIRYGHFYAHRLCDRLASSGVLHDVEDGVVRVSLLHYNTEDEIDRLCDCLEEILV